VIDPNRESAARAEEEREADEAATLAVISEALGMDAADLVVSRRSDKPSPQVTDAGRSVWNLLAGGDKMVVVPQPHIPAAAAVSEPRVAPPKRVSTISARPRTRGGETAGDTPASSKMIALATSKTITRRATGQGQGQGQGAQEQASALPARERRATKVKAMESKAAPAGRRTKVQPSG
jgi:hypothetical protein